MWKSARCPQRDSDSRMGRVERYPDPVAGSPGAGSRLRLHPGPEAPWRDPKRRCSRLLRVVRLGQEFPSPVGARPGDPRSDDPTGASREALQTALVDRWESRGSSTAHALEESQVCSSCVHAIPAALPFERSWLPVEALWWSAPPRETPRDTWLDGE